MGFHDRFVSRYYTGEEGLDGVPCYQVLRGLDLNSLNTLIRSQFLDLCSRRSYEEDLYIFNYVFNYVKYEQLKAQYTTIFVDSTTLIHLYTETDRANGRIGKMPAVKVSIDEVGS